MDWTEEQKKVIYLRNRNILVSAAAGSGKTAVLVERIIQMVSDASSPVDMDELLIVTFTNAAAGEMKERIAAAIEKKLAENLENEHLQRQIALIHTAKIMTIHSFCLDVIRNHFDRIQLDPSFRLGDEAELKLLRGDVAEELLEQKYEEKDASFIRFIESYATGKTDKNIIDLIMQLYTFSMSYPRPSVWLDGLKKNFQVINKDGTYCELEKLQWIQEMLRDVRRQFEDCMQINEKAMKWCEDDGPYMYKDALQMDRDILEILCMQNTYEDIRTRIHSIKWTMLSRKKDEAVSTEKRERTKALRNQVKDEIKKLAENYFSQGEEQILERMHKVCPVMETLIELTKEFIDLFQQKKQERNLVDFNDLEHYALQILIDWNGDEAVPTVVADELAEQFKEILIDEYQDSNYVQELLLGSISRERRGQPNRFMVGDVKQSIYKFRLARPEIFMEKYETYSLEDDLYQRIDLSKNFRSRESVLKAANRIFEQIMQKDLGNITYDEKAALYAGAEFKPAPEGKELDRQMDVLVIETDKTESEVSGKELEARTIAASIRKLFAEGTVICGKDGYRPIEYGDIVILLRTMTGWSDEFVEVLSSEGIPAYTDTQTGYFMALEIQTILQFLLVLDNPRQDIPLAAVLRSPIGGFSDEELAKIRILDKERPFYECLFLYEQMKEETDLVCKEKVSRFRNMLQELRECIPYKNVYELIQYIYQVTGYMDYVSVLPGGSVRKANLLMLLEKATAFEQTSYSGLFQFNRYIEKLQKYSVDYGEASGEAEKNAVRIMSIHKSKGLEFPVVFVAGMGKSFNQQDARSSLAIHADMGLGPDYVDIEHRTKMPTLIKKVIQKKQVTENLGEELRVLYVALTRAKEKLYLVGSVGMVDKKLENWDIRGLQLYGQRSSATNYFDWVMPVVLKEQAVPEEKKMFRIQILSEKDIMTEAVGKQLDREWIHQTLLAWDSKAHLTEEQMEYLNGYMNYSYPYIKEQEIKGKLTVSELKHLVGMEEEEETRQFYEVQAEREAYVPAFVEQMAEKTGAQRGTLYHKIMELLDFNTTASKNDINRQLQEFVEQGRLQPEDREQISVYKLQQFFENNLGIRMRKAAEKGKLYREQPFVYGVPARRINQEYESDVTVIVQGVIDAYFEEDDGLVLMDYKTDYIQKIETLEERYRAQLIYYKEALEQLTGKKVKEMAFYSFCLNESLFI